MAKAKTTIKKEDIEKDVELKESNRFLSASHRENLIAKLVTLGYLDGENLDDEELLEKLQELALSMHRSAISEEADLIQTKLAALFSESVITDMDFKLQLYHAGIERHYIHLFNDTHAKLVQVKKRKVLDAEGNPTDVDEEYDDMSRIWDIIRASGINPMGKNEIYKYRGNEPERPKPARQVY
jgi:hypothetical protein